MIRILIRAAFVLLLVTHETRGQATLQSAAAVRTEPGSISGSTPGGVPLTEQAVPDTNNVIRTTPGTIRGDMPSTAPTPETPIPSGGTVTGQGANGVFQTEPGSIQGGTPVQAPTPVTAIPSDGTVTGQSANGVIQTEFGSIQGGVPTQTPIPVAVVRESSPALGTLRAVGSAAGGLIASPKRDGGVFTCVISSEFGRQYSLEYKDSLNDPAWTALPPTVGTGALLVLRDPSGPRVHRIYRVRQW
jgi:hypothetical protein